MRPILDTAGHNRDQSSLGYRTMQGDARVIEYLNRAVQHELTAINQYWLHYRLLDNWGYRALAKQWRKESMEEMQHADCLTDIDLAALHNSHSVPIAAEIFSALKMRRNMAKIARDELHDRRARGWCCG